MNINTQRFSKGALSALVLALGATIIVATGCGETENRLQTKDINVSEFALVRSKNFANGSGVDNLTVSGDGKHVYVTTNSGASLFHNNGTDLSQGWAPVLVETGFDGSAGKAKLDKVESIIKIAPAKDGAIVSVKGVRPAAGDNVNHGVLYLKGIAHQAAWSPNLQDLDAGAPAGNNANPAGKLSHHEPVRGFVVSKDGVDVPYFYGFDVNDTPAGVIRYTFITKADLTPAKASAASKATDITGGPIYAVGKNFLFAFLNDKGISAIAAADFGTAKDFPTVTDTAAAATTGVAGLNLFRMVTGVNNRKVSAMLVDGDDLYVSFNFDANQGGGVGVFDVKAGTVAAPDVSWRGIAISGLFADKGKVWAYNDTNIFEAKKDGKKGGSYIDQPEFEHEPSDDFDTAPENSFKRDSFPREGIQNVVIVNSKPVIQTTKGLLYLKTTAKKLAGTKVEEKKKDE